jgi:hypothetical protein
MEKGKVVDAEQILADNIKYEAKHTPTISAPQDTAATATITEGEVAADVSLVEAPVETAPETSSKPTEEDIAVEDK